eukprot:TRINITY_DN13163_c0_g1_i1.p1 TRINITY_DN13163_c0_g1~~TRINITY_DN13163_c0_g1_i1.p1  ORF type:complete len:133 (-),score=26.00 TRINITY_DN13163_c0_g1_i1:231-629(-)
MWRNINDNSGNKNYCSNQNNRISTSNKRSSNRNKSSSLSSEQLDVDRRGAHSSSTSAMSSNIGTSNPSGLHPNTTIKDSYVHHICWIAVDLDTYTGNRRREENPMTRRWQQRQGLGVSLFYGLLDPHLLCSA